jgi:long-chain acyl-CoA synthetase
MDPRRPVDDYQLPWRSFADFFLSRPADGTPFLTALDHEAGTRRTWDSSQWRRQVLATARWLRNQGVQPGDAVATLAGNSAEALAAAYGCWVLGACCVPLNPADPTTRQAYAVTDAGAALLLHSAHHAERAAELAAAAPVKLHQTDGLLSTGPADTATEEDGGDLGVDLSSPALRVYTSGTTGDPKGVVLPAASLLIDVDALARTFGWDHQTRVITVLPIHHVNGLVISSLLPWRTGSSTVLCDRFRSDRFWADVAAERAAVCSMVPTLLEFLLAADGDRPETFTEVYCGAGPLLVETVLDFEDRFQVPVRHLYGLSETTCVATVMPSLPDVERRHWHRAHDFPSIGPAVPHTEVAILDATGSKVVDPGIRGEIAIRGATLMTGYAGYPAETATAFDGGWFHSGDEGFWQPAPDAAGTPYFFVTGRLKELIIRGGVNVSPYEIDTVLRTHRAVRYGLAVPFDNRFYGDEIAAYVVPSEPVTEEEILAHCARHLDHSRRPKVVLFGEDIPYTATGKAKRLELKRRLAPQLAQYRDVPFRKSEPSGRHAR